MCKLNDNLSRFNMLATFLLLAVLSGVIETVVPAAAQTNTSSHPFSFYIPTAVPTTTTTMLVSGSGTMPGRVGVDKSGDVFYVGHANGTTSTLYEIPASGSAVTISAPTPLISGIGQANSNSVFVDAAGTLWVSNGNGSGGALIEIRASAGIPDTMAITSNGSYDSSTGLPLTNIVASCTSAPVVPCLWSAASIGSSLTSLQIADVYSDGAGDIYLVDVSDSVSSGSYNRVIEFNTSADGTMTVLADKLTSNPYAQITVAGDGNPYYCDSVTGNTGGGLVSSISGGALTTVGNLPSASLTLLNGIVNVAAAAGVTTDPWGNLIISGPTQLAEVPLEDGALSWIDQFNLLVAIASSNSPMYTNQVVYGGTFDVHGNYYYASATNIMETQVGGYNFGRVNLGTEVTTAAPYLNITWSLPSYLETSLEDTASPSSLSGANETYLQSFSYGGGKNYYGGTPYSASNTGQYSLMHFQAVHSGLQRGSISPQGFSTAIEALDSSAGEDFYMNGAYQANLQGVGVGPVPMFIPGTASQAVTVSQLYTSYAQTAKAVAFTPMGVAVDSLGDIFVADTANTSLDLDCLATTANTAQNYRAGAAGNGYTNSYCMTNGLAATNSTNLAGSTFKVSATGVTGTSFATSFITPVDVVTDGANNTYVLDSASGTAAVTKMAYATMIPTVVIPSGTIVGGAELNVPQGLAIDGYGNLYIADTGNNRILQAHLYNATYSQNIVYVPSSTAFDGSALNGPMGMGLDAAGDLFIADTGNHRIVEYSVTGVGSVVSTAGVTLDNPTNVKVLPSGALIVADSTLGLVLVNNGTGSVLSTGAITLSSTQGLALDQSGNAYVADPAGSQVVELYLNAPAAASIFPSTLIGTSSSETSYIFNEGNALLNISADPATTDNSTAANDEFGVDAANECTAGASLSTGDSCSMVMDFTPASTATAYVYSMVNGTATVADSLPSYTLTANPTSGAEAIGTFGTTGSTQSVTLSGNPTVPMTTQQITFDAVSPVTWSASIPTIQLVATGGATGNPVTFSVVSGSGTLSGPNNSILTLTDIGTTVIAANQEGAYVNGTYYAAAPQVTQMAVVNPIGIVTAPTFSVPAGTYTAVQSVTISEATSGATIYYTTNGNTPTTSSPIYTAGTAIPVNVTTTIQAIAVEAGYTTSTIASAMYILNPDFVFKSYQTTFNIPVGLGGGTTLSVAPLFGFNSPVTFSCSGLPAYASCGFLPANPALGASPTSTLKVSVANGATSYATFEIQLNNTAAALRHPAGGPFAPLGALAFSAVFLFGIRKHRRLLMVGVLMLGGIGTGMMSGCSSAAVSDVKSTTTFTLTATSGSVVHSSTITLIVNNY